MGVKLEELCRLCIRKRPALNYTVYGKYCGVFIKDMIKNAYGFRVFNENAKNVCEECLVKLDIVCKIKKDAKAANVQYYRILRAIAQLTAPAPEDVPAQKPPQKEEELEPENGEDLVEVFCEVDDVEVPKLQQASPLKSYGNSKRTLLKLEIVKEEYKVEETVTNNVDDSLEMAEISDEIKVEEAAAKDEKKECNICGNDSNEDLLQSGACPECAQIIDAELDQNGPEILTSNRPRAKARAKHKTKCYICDQIIQIVEKDEHFLTHSDVEMICTFEHCNDQTFSKMSLFNSHLAFHDPNRVYKCRFCYKRFGDRHGKNDHELLHPEAADMDPEPAIPLKERSKKERTRKKPIEKYPCQYCGKQFDHHQDCNRHENRVHRKSEAKVYECEDCRQLFYNPWDLRKHVKVHALTPMDGFMCETCGKSFREKMLLREHIYIHTGQKPYHCDYCNKDFRTRQWFLKHRRLNACKLDAKVGFSIAGVQHRRYSCNICQKPMGISRNYATHMRTFHPEITKIFSCDYCEEKFETAEQKRNHELQRNTNKNKICGKKGTRINRKTYECDLCGNVIGRYNDLLKHLNDQHPGVVKKFECKVCNKFFAHYANLNKHSKIHLGIKKHECEFCGERYVQRSNLDRHRRVFHTKETPYECKCGKKYADSSYFSRHKRNCFAMNEPEIDVGVN